ncbi:MAG: PQQ-binding-like beta-propeller repeat protein [Phycisphaerae bacterium]|nr:PQQ-binding-like beta-propeller repeat protein [Phycisphaerae bacterium]
MRKFGKDWIIAVLCILPNFSSSTCAGDDSWPMLAHDPARSGSTTQELRPPFERKWYRLFPDEGIFSGVQPIVADGKVIIGSMKGILHAIDAETGKDIWAFDSGGAILHAVAVAEGRVFFGNKLGKIIAVNLADGRMIWSQVNPLAVWNSPLVHDGVVIVGGRDSFVYAFDVTSGGLRWKSSVGGPVLSSPAMDVRNGRIYVAAENMQVYAIDVADGKIIWTSPKLPGASFRGYHPVVAPDGSVMVTVTPVMTLDNFEPILLNMVKAIFGDFASWRHNKEDNDRLRKANFEKLADPKTYDAQLDYIRKRLTDQPAYQTFFVLDPATGKQKFVAPIVYAESMNGTQSPPLVTPDGKVIVKFQALLRSRYEHYSPFLNVGCLDTTTGYIVPIMDQSRTYGWHDSLLLVHDEMCQLVVAGRVLINTHQDNVNAMDLDTLKGYGEPFCRNIHEPKEGQPLGIWAKIFRNETIPNGQEWLVRGTAVYGGGSVIDTPVIVAGESFYFLPTHELNSGCALIAYRMKAGGDAGKETPPLKADLSADEVKKITTLPWDWDMLDTPRLKDTLKSLPDKIEGTMQRPLSKQQIQSRRDVITDSQLDQIVWQTPNVEIPKNLELSDLRSRINLAVTELLESSWAPWIFPSGKHPRQAYRYFTEPAELLEALAMAYPFLDPDLKSRIRDYVAILRQENEPLSGPVGQKRFSDVGAARSYYDLPPADLLMLQDDQSRSDLARLYSAWLWAERTNDFDYIRTFWPQIRSWVDSPPDDKLVDCGNAHLSGLIAYCRLARRFGDSEAQANGLRAARQAMRERLAYEFSHPKGGLILPAPTGRSVYARWRNLTPEVGRLLAAFAGDIQKDLMATYVDFHRPTWYLAWNVETLWRNESPLDLPTSSMEIFAARAWIVNEKPNNLMQYIDIPWCKADLFCLRKLAITGRSIATQIGQLPEL